MKIHLVSSYLILSQKKVIQVIDMNNITGRYRLTRTLFLLSIALLYCLQSTAQAERIDIVDRSKAAEVIQGKKDDIPLISEEREKQIDAVQSQISEKVITAATWFDSFFGDERYIAEENRSTVRLLLNAGIDKHEDLSFKPRIRMTLHVPQVDERLNFLISGNDDEDFDVERDPGNLNTRDDDANLTAALQYFLLQTEKMNISSSFGLSYNYAYAGLRYRGTQNYGSWQGRIISRARYYTDDGWEARTRYDIERQISDKWLFRTTLDANWQEKNNGIPHGVIFSLFQVLNLDRAIQYDIGNYFHTRENYHMTDFVIRLSYRQRFYRDWLVFEVQPQVSFPKEYDRETNPGIIFKLEAEFGYKSYKDQFNRIFAF